MLLYLNDNNFSSYLTGEVIKALVNSSSITTIRNVQMINSSDFSSHNSCAQLAQLVDKAEKLTHFLIDD